MSSVDATVGAAGIHTQIGPPLPQTTTKLFVFFPPWIPEPPRVTGPHYRRWLHRRRRLGCSLVRSIRRELGHGRHWSEAHDSPH